MKIRILGIAIAISTILYGLETVEVESNRIFTLNKKELNKFYLDLQEENYLTVKMKHPICIASILTGEGRKIGKTNNMSGEFNERLKKGKYYINIHPNGFCKTVEFFTPEFAKEKKKSEENQKESMIIVSDKEDKKIDYKKKYEECMKRNKNIR